MNFSLVSLKTKLIEIMQDLIFMMLQGGSLIFKLVFKFSR